MITKKPIDKNKFAKDIHFTSSARVGFKYLLKELSFNNEEKILLPAYIGITDREGSGVFDPISDLNIKYDFYKIKKNFQVDLDDLILKLKTGKVKAVLIIHYFGFLHCDIEFISEFCKTNNIILIEDCAHAFVSKHKDRFLGSYGDYSFYSIHKFLPTKDGGILQINNNDSELSPFSDVEKKISFDTLQQFSKVNFDEISMVCKRNYNYLIEKIYDIDEIELLFPQLPDGIVPMNLPIIVKNNKREKLYFNLMEVGIPTIALYYRLIDSIDERLYPDSYYLSNNILNLPIHQDITKEDIELLTEELNNIINKI